VDENGMITDTPPDKTKRSKTSAKDIEVSIPKQDPSEAGNKIKSGRLTFFNEIKGYGFINESVTGQSIFVHINDFQDEISKGDLVSFEMGKGQRGPAAFNVKRQK
jgi:cold shock CspA family protein